MTVRTALIRRPGPRLAEGIVTHLARTPVDLGRAAEQHAAYVAALAGHGWSPLEVPPADDCPDAVFVEDAVVVSAGLAVLTRPGAEPRRGETVGLAPVLAGLGLDVATIEAPGTLDGGDVLQIGTTVYIGRGGRTNAAGIAQLRALLTPRGRTVVAVPLGAVLHLKSAATALPDATVLTWGPLVDRSLFPAVREMPEEAGAHVVVLDAATVLIAASAPRSADAIADLGFTPVVVDISEFERLEGCVTCLSVLIPTG